MLDSLETLDSDPDIDFNRITGLAAALLDAPVALITLIDLERQWFKSCFGVEERETPVSISFCAHAIAAGDEIMVVENALLDPLFSANPLVTGDHHLRFYVGAPLVVDGARLGTLCVLDRRPRPRPSPEILDQLKALAGIASSLFALKDGARTGALARAALAREEGRRAIAVEAAGLASWVWDVRTDRVECDVVLPVLFNLAPASHIDVSKLFAAIDRRDVTDGEQRFRRSLVESDDYFVEYRVKTIEPPRWLASRGRVIERDADGNPTLVFGVSYDVSERKSAEERQRLLLRELNHRVKNTLATVQALATQTVRHARQPQQFLEAFSGRLQALGAAHSLLSDHEWRGIGMAELVRREITPFEEPPGSRIAISGPDLLLTPDQALGLGLILHELASNALQYGSLSAPGGCVSLIWQTAGLRDERRLVVNWSERGGPAVTTPQHYGFGSILIRRSLAKIISSEVKHEFAPEGVTAEISMLLEERDAQ